MTTINSAKLNWIHWLRWIAIAFQLALAPFAFHYGYLENKNLLPYLAVPAALSVLNIKKIWGGFGFYNNISFQAILDTVAFTALVVVTGKLENPFWPLIYLHAAMGAILIEPKKDYQYLPFLVASIATVQALSIRHYSSIAFVLIPQWLILLAIWFLTRNIGLFLLRQEKLIHELHKKELKGQKINAVGLLSSGILHEIGTPLNTVRLKIDRLKAGKFNQIDMDVLDKSLGSVEDVISKLNQAHMESEGNILQATPILSYVNEMAVWWKDEFPDLDFHINSASEDIEAKLSKTNFALILRTLVSNSSEAGAKNVEINIGSSEASVAISFKDDGPGFDPFILENFMAPYTSTKGKGRGIGLFNAGLGLESMGGELNISNDQGALVLINLERAL